MGGFERSGRAQEATPAGDKVDEASKASAPSFRLPRGYAEYYGLGAVPEIAAQGTSGAGDPLPHQAEIQRSFGRHEVGAVQAHTDARAARAAESLGAEAFASGNHVAFAGAPSLHTAAHEAAHVVQQRAGVQLKGGLGEAGDRYEQHADRVADQVALGRSAEPLLDEVAPPLGAGASAGPPPIQRKIKLEDGRLLSSATPAESAQWVAQYSSGGLFDGAILSALIQEERVYSVDQALKLAHRDSRRKGGRDDQGGDDDDQGGDDDDQDDPGGAAGAGRPKLAAPPNPKKLRRWEAVLEGKSRTQADKAGRSGLITPDSERLERWQDESVYLKEQTGAEKHAQLLRRVIQDLTAIKNSLTAGNREQIKQALTEQLPALLLYMGHNASHAPPQGLSKVQSPEQREPLFYYRSQSSHPHLSFYDAFIKKIGEVNKVAGFDDVHKGSFIAPINPAVEQLFGETFKGVGKVGDPLGHKTLDVKDRQLFPHTKFRSGNKSGKTGKQGFDATGFDPSIAGEVGARRNNARLYSEALLTLFTASASAAAAIQTLIDFLREFYALGEAAGAPRNTASSRSNNNSSNSSSSSSSNDSGNDNLNTALASLVERLRELVGSYLARPAGATSTEQPQPADDGGMMIDGVDETGGPAGSDDVEMREADGKPPKTGDAEAPEEPAGADGERRGSLFGRGLEYRAAFSAALARSLSTAQFKYLRVFCNENNPNLIIQVLKPPMTSGDYGVGKVYFKEGWVQAVLSFFAGLLNKAAADNDVPVYTTRRQSFGFLRPTVTDLPEAIRLSMGAQPLAFAPVVLEAVCNLEAAIAGLDPDTAAEVFLVVEPGTMQGDHLKRFMKTDVRKAEAFDMAELFAAQGAPGFSAFLGGIVAKSEGHIAEAKKKKKTDDVDKQKAQQEKESGRQDIERSHLDETAIEKARQHLPDHEALTAKAKQRSDAALALWNRQTRAAPLQGNLSGELLRAVMALAYQTLVELRQPDSRLPSSRRWLLEKVVNLATKGELLLNHETEMTAQSPGHFFSKAVVVIEDLLENLVAMRATTTADPGAEAQPTAEERVKQLVMDTYGIAADLVHVHRTDSGEQAGAVSLIGAVKEKEQSQRRMGSMNPYYEFDKLLDNLQGAAARGQKKGGPAAKTLQDICDIVQCSITSAGPGVVRYKDVAVEKLKACALGSPYTIVVDITNSDLFSPNVSTAVKQWRSIREQGSDQVRLVLFPSLLKHEQIGLDKFQAGRIVVLGADIEGLAAVAESARHPLIDDFLSMMQQLYDVPLASGGAQLERQAPQRGSRNSSASGQEDDEEPLASSSLRGRSSNNSTSTTTTTTTTTTTSTTTTSGTMPPSATYGGGLKRRAVIESDDEEEEEEQSSAMATSSSTSTTSTSTTSSASSATPTAPGRRPKRKRVIDDDDDDDETVSPPTAEKRKLEVAANTDDDDTAPNAALKRLRKEAPGESGEPASKRSRVDESWVAEQKASIEKKIRELKARRVRERHMQSAAAETALTTALGIIQQATLTNKEDAVALWERVSALFPKPAVAAPPPVQQQSSGAVSGLAAGGEGGTSQVHAAAELGLSGAGGSLPHLAEIQRSFGPHDMSGIVAHTDSKALQGAQAMNASAFATGERVAFAGAPTLHTAAHEAAHVVQQRAGVELSGGVGRAGDAYEQHADAVADAVVAGRSATALVGPVSARLSVTQGTQRLVQRELARYEKAADIDRNDLRDLDALAHRQADWASAVVDEGARERLRGLLAFARANPVILDACGHMNVRDLGNLVGDAAAQQALLAFAEAATAKRTKKTAKITSRTNAADALKWGAILCRLEPVLGGEMMELALDEESLRALSGGQIVDNLIAYMNTQKANLDGPGDIKAFGSLCNEGGFAAFKGLPIRNLHRFTGETLLSLLKNHQLLDVSPDLPLSLILYSRWDHSGSFTRTPEIAKLAQRPNRITILIEGSDSLDAHGGQAAAYAKRASKPVDEIMLAGHGNAPHMQMAGTDKKSEKDGTGKLTTNTKHSKEDREATERFLAQILGLMPDAPDSRLVIKSCLVASNILRDELDSKDPDKAREQALAQLKQQPDLFDKIQEVAKSQGRSQVDVRGAMSSISGAKLQDPTGRMDLDLTKGSGGDPTTTRSSNPEAGHTKSEYVREGKETYGVVRAVMDVWLEGREQCAEALKARLAKPIGKGFDENVVQLVFKIILREMNNGDLIRQLAEAAYALGHTGETKGWVVASVERLESKIPAALTDELFGFLESSAPKLVNSAYWAVVYQAWMLRAPAMVPRFIKALNALADEKADVNTLSLPKYVDTAKLKPFLDAILTGPTDPAPLGQSILALRYLVEDGAGAPDACKKYVHALLGDRGALPSRVLSRLLGADPAPLLRELGVANAGKKNVAPDHVENTIAVTSVTKTGVVKAEVEALKSPGGEVWWFARGKLLAGAGVRIIGECKDGQNQPYYAIEHTVKGMASVPDIFTVFVAANQITVV